MPFRFLFSLITLFYANTEFAQTISISNLKGEKQETINEKYIIFINNKICATCISKLSTYLQDLYPDSAIIYTVKKTNNPVLNYNNVTQYSSLANDRQFYLVDLKFDSLFYVHFNKDKSPFIIRYMPSKDSIISHFKYSQIFDNDGEIRSDFKLP